jgi:hypothetical protein
VATFHFERALFVIGEPNAGKSNQLRAMFRDVRFGLNGRVPTTVKLRDIYRLSNERALYLRLTSPHEANESLKEFLDKTNWKFTARSGTARRWNFVGPLQPNKAHKMPNAVDQLRRSKSGSTRNAYARFF